MLLKIKYDTGGHFLHLQVVIFVFLTKLSSIFFFYVQIVIYKEKKNNLSMFRQFDAL